MRRLIGVILTLTTALLAAGFVTAAPAAQAAGPAAPYGQRLDWSDCGGGFQCAKLKVPLDHAKPNGRRIEIAVIRLRAQGPKRIGSLVLNPGGPGGSGVDLARNAKLFISAEVRARFDVVGFDPRGVGLSTPVRCVSAGVLDTYHALDPTPDTPYEVRKGDAYQKVYADGCEANAGRLLAHVGTRDAARDIDVLRAALGDRRLTYLGFSYGTLLGATYAELFPKRVRAMVLDGAVDPAKSGGEEVAGQARGFEVAFAAFLRDCYQAPGCPFRTHRVNASFKRMAVLFKRADRAPLRNDADGRQVNEALVWRGVMASMYAKQMWPSLRAALADAFKGDGTALLASADRYNGRLPDGSYANSGEAFTAVNCVDAPASTATRSQVTYVPESRYFGKYFSDGLLSPCAFWPVKAKGVTGPLHAEGSPPILVVGTTRDPATPYRDARALAAQLSAGVLLGFDGDGHTAYGGPSACVNGAVDRYLITRVPPKNGTVCPKVS